MEFQFISKEVLLLIPFECLQICGASCFVGWQGSCDNFLVALFWGCWETEVSLANLLWAVALVQLSPPEVHPVLQVHDKVFQEARRVELIRLLWALGVVEWVRGFSFVWS